MHLSKSMSYVLRHGADQMGLQISSGEGNAFTVSKSLSLP